MGTYSLAADPSFKSFIPGGQEIPSDSRVLLQLYECQEQEEPLSWLRKLSKSTKWVAIISPRQRRLCMSEERLVEIRRAPNDTRQRSL